MYDTIEDMFSMVNWSPFSMLSDSMDIPYQVDMLKMLIKENLSLSLDYQNTKLRIDQNNVQITHTLFVLSNFLDQKEQSEKVAQTLKELFLFVFEESVKMEQQIEENSLFFIDQFLNVFQSFDQIKHFLMAWEQTSQSFLEHFILIKAKNILHQNIDKQRFDLPLMT
jgi:cellulose biosynthesis protein BcsQ